MRPLACLLAAALLAACSRDLDVPAAATGPKIAGFSPASAFAGEWVTITGSGFDTDPLGNLVQFARASARAESFAGGAIALRVPVDAGSGPFTVATRGGISSPSTPFTYRGRGELRSRAVTGQYPMLHKPYRLIPTRSDTYLHSDLLLGIVRYADPSFIATSAVSMDSAGNAMPNGSVVWLESYSLGADSLLVHDGGPMYGRFERRVPYAGVGPVAVMTGYAPLWTRTAVVLRQGKDLVTGAPEWSVAVHDLVASDLAPAAGWPDPVSLGTAIADLRGCADAGSGDLACLARRTADDPLTLARIRFTTNPPVVTFLDPPGQLVEDRFLPSDPICGDPRMRRAVVALADGNIAAADMNAGVFLPPGSTGSRSPARSLACEVSTGYVIVAKPADDVVIKTPTSASPDMAPAWSVVIPKASAVAICESCANPRVEAAGEGDNRVFQIDKSTGWVLARRSFDVLPGRVDPPSAPADRTGMGGAAWFHPQGDDPYLVFPTAAPRGTIRWPLTLRRASDVFPRFHPSEALAVVPGISGEYDMVLEDLAFEGNALTSTAQLAVDAPFPYAHAATDAGLETLIYDLVAPTQHALSPLPGARFTSLGLLPDSRVYASLRSDSGWSVRAWDPTLAGSGAPAGDVWPSPAGGAWAIQTSAVLDGGLWAFYWDPRTNDPNDDEFHAVGLSETLTTEPGTDVVLPDPFYSVLAVSPNGRTFVSWDFQQFSSETSVVIWSGDPATGFARLETIPVQGQVAGAAFDGTGEKLYVVTRSPERIVVIE